MSISVPWAVWSEAEPDPTSDVMVAYNGYLRLLDEVIGPGAAARKEWQRRRDAFVYGHVEAGYSREEAKQLFAEHEMTADQREMKRRQVAGREDYLRRRVSAEERFSALEAHVRDREMLEFLRAEARYAEFQERPGDARSLWEERYALLDAQAAYRHEQDRKMQAVFEAAGGRAAWCVQERAKGRTLRSIGDEGGMSGSRVSQLLAKEEGKAARAMERRVRWERGRQNLGRPLDMGGPRDIWLHFYPEAESRAAHQTDLA